MIKKPILILLFVLWASVGWATDYYVDCSLGTGANDGTSPTDAWQTLSAITGLSNGDDLYLKNDTTCTVSSAANELDITWNGVDADNRSVIGCYTSEGVFTCTVKPIIDGQGTYPTVENGLVRYKGTTAIYITIENLNVRNSGWYGIVVNDTTTPAPTGGTGILIQKNYIYRSETAGILLYRTDDSTVTLNTVEESSYLTSPSGGIVVSANGLDNGSNNNTVSYNTVFHTYEGINITRKAEDNIVEYNVVYDTRGPHIYMDASKRTTVRYNLVYDSSEKASWNGSTPGILLDNESAYGYCFLGGNKIHNNLIAGTSTGISMQNQRQWNADETCTLDDNLIYANTIVDVTLASLRNRFYGDEGAQTCNGTTCTPWSGNEFKNNISWTLSGGNHVRLCDTAGLGIDYENNLWDDDPGTGACDDASDPANSDPGLTLKSGWQTLTAEGVTGQEFSFDGPTAHGVDDGIDITDYNNRISNDPITTDFHIPGAIVVSTTEDGAYPDIGAWLYGDGGPSDPVYPLQGVAGNFKIE